MTGGYVSIDDHVESWRIAGAMGGLARALVRCEEMEAACAVVHAMSASVHHAWTEDAMKASIAEFCVVEDAKGGVYGVCVTKEIVAGMEDVIRIPIDHVMKIRVEVRGSIFGSTTYVTIELLDGNQYVFPSKWLHTRTLRFLTPLGVRKVRLVGNGGMTIEGLSFFHMGALRERLHRVTKDRREMFRRIAGELEDVARISDEQIVVPYWRARGQGPRTAGMLLTAWVRFCSLFRW